ncbi:alpha-1,2-fucosyltransferase [Dechloromonas sp. TW-R-39-2]|uniref:alpha-1,2-fucosyltransferase n=1 Tax=Dechloromonas sp. TW-R-39-2 TaxID=2654218 RepID=UPI00193D59CD|nr:alpha-1,2-fucosyltransferase [Dechloromonas sp. TW-R-39-2]
MKNNCTFITPTWPQFKVGPIIRNEPDKRFYTGMFRPGVSEVGGFVKCKRIVIDRKIPESSIGKARAGDMIVFEGLGDYFMDLIGYSSFLKSEFKKILISSNNIDSLMDKLNPRKSIAVHVRFGDFKVPTVSDLDNEVRNIRIPIEWYVAIVNQLNTHYSGQVKFNVFSDASDFELSPLLSLDNVSRALGGNAAEDILLISEHACLIASASTFSMWGAFLGQMPSIWYKGLKQQSLNDNSQWEIEVGMSDQIAPIFIENIKYE